MLVVICLVWICSTIHDVTAECADGYVRHESSCYRLFHNMFTWPEASAFCRSFNTHLVYIETQSEFGFLQARAAEVGGMGFWTGATDALTENEWIFNETGERMTLTIDWGPNEPDHASGRDCLGLEKAGDYKLAAWDCRTLLKPICETDFEDQGSSIIG